MAAALGWWMQVREGDPRALTVAALASIAFHAAVLLAFPELKGRKTTIFPGPITARLVSPPSAVAPPAPVTQADETSKPKAEQPPARSVPRVRPPAPAPVEPLVSARPAVQQPAPAPSGGPPSPERAKPAAETAQAALSPPAPLAKSELQPGADEAGTLAQYRIAIIAAARRFKKYPRVAVDNNWEGRVEVRMVIGPNGAIAALGIRTSTGHEALDRQALDMIRRAIPVTPIPAPLRSREITVDVPVIFSLREETGG